jgi:iron complex outermembrane receptor protein
MPSLLLRGSWGEGFPAQPLYTLSEPNASAGITIIEDPVRCPVIIGQVDDCLAFVEVLSGGNPDLQPETSMQWNVGAVWEPVRGLSLGVDYWAIEQKGIIGPLSQENLMLYNQRFPDRITCGPVDPAFPNLPGPIVAIDVSPPNLGTTQTSSFEVFVNWLAPPWDWGQVRVGLQGTYVRRWETQVDGVT